MADDDVLYGLTREDVDKLRALMRRLDFLSRPPSGPQPRPAAKNVIVQHHTWVQITSGRFSETQTITVDASGGYWLVSGVVEVQTITVSGQSGVWTITGSPTDLAYNATAAAVQAAARTATSLLVTVTGSVGGPYTVTWPATGPHSLLTVDYSALKGIVPLVSVAHAVPGLAGSGTHLVYNETSANVQTVAQAVTGVAVTVTGPDGGPWALTWPDQDGHVLLVLDSSHLTGGTHTATNVETHAGTDNLYPGQWTQRDNTTTPPSFVAQGDPGDIWVGTASNNDTLTVDTVYWAREEGPNPDDGKPVFVVDDNSGPASTGGGLEVTDGPHDYTGIVELLITGGAALTALVGNPGAGIAEISYRLDDTAVTPSTNGDSTHVGQFTVDQQGRLTAASSVAITYPSLAIASPPANSIQVCGGSNTFDSSGNYLFDPATDTLTLGGVNLLWTQTAALITWSLGAGPSSTFTLTPDTFALRTGGAGATPDVIFTSITSPKGRVGQSGSPRVEFSDGANNRAIGVFTGSVDLATDTWFPGAIGDGQMGYDGTDLWFSKSGVGYKVGLGGPTGGAGGDLTGTYPNPTLVSIGPGPGTYTVGARLTPGGTDGTITIDAQGRITAITQAT